jgi:hypothetical protein
MFTVCQDDRRRMRRGASAAGAADAVAAPVIKDATNLRRFTTAPLTVHHPRGSPQDSIRRGEGDSVWRGQHGIRRNASFRGTSGLNRAAYIHSAALRVHIKSAAGGFGRRLSQRGRKLSCDIEFLASTLSQIA